MLVALGRHREEDVAQALNLAAERLVHEGGVGEDVEDAILVGLGELEHVGLAHERLAAREHVHVAAKLGTLRHQAVHVIVGEVERMAVIGGPAADAMLVAGARGVEEDDPRDVAIKALGVLDRVGEPAERRLVAAAHDEGLEHVRVGLVDEVEEPLLPFGSRVEGGADALLEAGYPRPDELDRQREVLL